LHDPCGFTPTDEVLHPLHTTLPKLTQILSKRELPTQYLQALNGKKGLHLLDASLGLETME